MTQGLTRGGGKTDDVEQRACLCGAPLPDAPLTWGPRAFCSMACFSAWYVLAGHAGDEGAPEAYRDYADHAKACETCAAADHEDQLCPAGGALFDALDEDPTEPIVICEECSCAAPIHRLGCSRG